MHDGNLEDLVVCGNNVLEQEVRHARQIPSKERVFVRTDSAMFELR